MSTKDFVSVNKQSNTINHNNSNESISKGSSAASTVMRIYWMVGWVLPLLIISRIAFDKASSATYSCSLYLILWISMTAAKYLDVFKFNGLTADGKSATASNFYKYAVQTLLLFLIQALASTVFKK